MSSQSQNGNVPTTEVKDVKPSPIAIGHNGLIFTSLEEIWRFAQFAARSQMVPQTFTNPSAALVAIQYGLELGLTPVAALQNIAVINGRPALNSETMLALAYSSGQLERFDEFFEGEFPKEEFRAVCVVKRRGYSEVRREFSIADAMIAGLYGSESFAWKRWPKRMLQMRARSWALRDSFPDMLKGIRSVEELQDEPIDQPRVVVCEQPPQQIEQVEQQNGQDDSPLVSEPMPEPAAKPQRGRKTEALAKRLSDGLFDE